MILLSPIKQILVLLYLSSVKSQLQINPNSRRRNYNRQINLRRGVSSAAVSNPVLLNDQPAETTSSSLSSISNILDLDTHEFLDKRNKLSSSSFSQNHCPDTCFCQISNVITISCKNSKIKSFSDPTLQTNILNPNLYTEKPLVILDLSYNNITHILNKDLQHLEQNFKKLRVLNLNNNGIKFIENLSLKNFSGLRKLQLANNLLSNLDENLFYFNKRLRSL